MLSSQLICQLSSAHKAQQIPAFGKYCRLLSVHLYTRGATTKQRQEEPQHSLSAYPYTRGATMPLMKDISTTFCQLAPTREVQQPLSCPSAWTWNCQLAPTCEVQRQSCVPLRGLHVYQLHFLHAKACRLYGLFSTGLSFLQNCRKPCREFPYSTSCVGLRALPRLTALQSAENSGAKVLWFL